MIALELYPSTSSLGTPRRHDLPRAIYINAIVPHVKHSSKSSNPDCYFSSRGENWFSHGMNPPRGLYQSRITNKVPETHANDFDTRFDLRHQKPDGDKILLQQAPSGQIVVINVPKRRHTSTKGFSEDFSRRFTNMSMCDLHHRRSGLNSTVIACDELTGRNDEVTFERMREGSSVASRVSLGQMPFGGDSSGHEFLHFCEKDNGRSGFYSKRLSQNIKKEQRTSTPSGETIEVSTDKEIENVVKAEIDRRTIAKKCLYALIEGHLRQSFNGRDRPGDNTETEKQGGRGTGSGPQERSNVDTHLMSTENSHEKLDEVESKSKAHPISYQNFESEAGVGRSAKKVVLEEVEDEEFIFLRGKSEQ